jgi:hypothetical protein
MRTYIIHSFDQDAVKIGRSEDPRRRLAALQCANPSHLTLITVLEGDREGELHNMFQEYRVNGEWFRDDLLFSVEFEKLGDDVLEDVSEWLMWDIATQARIKFPERVTR